MDNRGKVFHEELATLFVRTELSIRRLSRELSVNHSSVTRWMNGESRPSYSHMLEISRHFSHFKSPSEWDDLVRLGGYAPGSLPHVPKPGPVQGDQTDGKQIEPVQLPNGNAIPKVGLMLRTDLLSAKAGFQHSLSKTGVSKLIWGESDG